MIGMPAGTFYQRGPLSRSDGEPLALVDLLPGNIVQMLGQEFHIIDADAFTRDYFR